MKFKAGIILFVVLCAGCISATPSDDQQVAGEPYVTQFLIGERRGDVIQKMEKAFGEPIEVNFFLQGSSAEVEIRRYKFTNVSNFVAYFYKEHFIQANLMPVGDKKFPDIRKDYRVLDFKNPGVVRGYSIAMDEQEVVLDTILSVSLKEE